MTPVLGLSGNTMIVPSDFTAGGATVWTFTAIFWALAIVALIWAARLRLRRESSIPLYLWFGGLAMCWSEPLFDHLVHLWWATDAPGPAFSMFNVDVPLWVPAIYASALSVPPYQIWRRLQRGAQKHDIVRIWGSFALVDIALEWPAVLTGAWQYYGPQPFEVAKFPLYNIWCNGVGFLAVGCVLYLMFPTGNGGVKARRAVFAPAAFVASWLIVPLPVVVSLNAPLADPIAWIIALGSLPLAYTVVRTLGRMVTTDGDWRWVTMADDRDGRRVDRRPAESSESNAGLPVSARVG